MPVSESSSNKVVTVAGLKAVYDSLLNDTKVVLDPADMQWIFNTQLYSATNGNNAMGTLAASGKYAVMKYPFYMKSGSRITPGEGYSLNGVRYSKDNSGNYVAESGISLRSTALVLDTDGWYRFGFRPAGNINTVAKMTAEEITKTNIILNVVTGPASEFAVRSDFVSEKNKEDIASLDASLNAMLAQNGLFMQGFGSVMDNTTRQDDTWVHSGKIEGDRLDNAKINTIYFFNQCLQRLQNRPEDDNSVSGMLITFAAYKNLEAAKQTKFQVLFTRNQNVWFRFKIASGEFTDWKLLGGTDAADFFNSKKYFINTCVDKTKAKLNSNDTFLAIGDSITVGSGTNEETNWTNILSSATGASFYKSAKSGIGFVHEVDSKNVESMVDDAYSKYCEPFVNQNETPALTEAEFWSGINVIFIAAGINDAAFFAGVQENGNYVQMPVTYAGVKIAVQDVIDKIRTHSNSAHIVFITPIRNGSATELFGERLSTIAGTICHVALTNGCSVINGFDFPIPLNSIADGAIANLSSDNTHPNELGRKIYAQSVINAIM